MSVDIDIITLDQPHVLAVPADAVRRDPDNTPYVLLVKNGMTSKRRITLASTSDTQAVVTSGLHAGDTIVAERNLGIVDGMRVSPTFAPSPAPTQAP